MDPGAEQNHQLTPLRFSATAYTSNDVGRSAISSGSMREQLSNAARARIDGLFTSLVLKNASKQPFRRK
jgi:hypothetical protein